MDPKKMHKLTQELTRRLLDDGLIIQAGYLGFCLAAYGKEILPPDQDKDLRDAFFAGSLHLFCSLMQGLDDEEEDTEADLRRMDNIQSELNCFEQAFKIKHGLV